MEAKIATPENTLTVPNIRLGIANLIEFQFSENFFEKKNSKNVISRRLTRLKHSQLQEKIANPRIALTKPQNRDRNLKFLYLIL